MVLFRITENEPSKMHNVRPYVYSRPWTSMVYYSVYAQLKVHVRIYEYIAGPVYTYMYL